MNDHLISVDDAPHLREKRSTHWKQDRSRNQGLTSSISGSGKDGLDIQEAKAVDGASLETQSTAVENENRIEVAGQQKKVVRRKSMW